MRTRLRILVRCALLLVLGTCLAVLGPPVGVILGYYAAWLALALPFLAWRPGACSSWRPSPRQSAL